jgi:Ca2+-binding EF-hand superfamily protein
MVRWFDVLGLQSDTMSHFSRVFTVLAFVALVAAQRSRAQDATQPGSPGGNARGGGAGGGGFPGGGFPGGGGFGGGGFGPGGGGFRGGFGRRGFGGGGGLEDVNTTQLVQRLDTNHDGVIETSEMNARVRPLLERAGLKTDEPVSNDRAIAAFEKLKSQSGPGGRFPPSGGDDMFGFPGGGPSSTDTGRSSTAKQEATVPALVPTFGEASDLAPVPGFGEGLAVATSSFGSDSQNSSASASGASSSSSNTGSSSAATGSSAPADDPKIRSYATSMMKRYDKNGDGVLDKTEWSQMSGDPEKYDRNHDGKITLDELVDSLKNWNRPTDDSSAAKPAAVATSSRPAASSSAPAGDAQAAAAGAQGGRNGGPGNRRDGANGRNSLASGGKHYLSPKERLPEGLPDWFNSSDADGDGQVSMHEFASPLTDEKLAEFAKYDLNGDGFITADEVLKVAPPKK